MLQVLISLYNFIASKSKSPKDRYLKTSAVYTCAFNELLSQINIQSHSRSTLLLKIWEGQSSELHKYYQNIIDSKDKEIKNLEKEVNKCNHMVISEMQTLRNNIGNFKY